MRVVVLGIGAVGGTLAARLADAGTEVLALARGAHAAAVRADGLLLEGPDGAVTARMDVVERPDDLDLRADDVLVLATKSQHTAGVLDALPPAARDLPLLLAQNGVANEREAARRHADVHGVCVMLPALHTEPGRVAVFCRPSAVLEVGRWPGGHDETDERVAEVFTAAGLLTRARDDVMAYKHRKLLTNLGNAVEALLGRELDDAGQEAVRSLHRRAVAEGERVLALAGAPLLDLAGWRDDVAAHLSMAEVDGRRAGRRVDVAVARPRRRQRRGRLPQRRGGPARPAARHRRPGQRGPAPRRHRRRPPGPAPGSTTPEELTRLVDAAEAAAA